MSQKIVVEIDDETFELEWVKITHLGLFQMMCEETEDDIVEAPLTGCISVQTFTQILEFMDYSIKNGAPGPLPQPLESNDLGTYMDKWYANFFVRKDISEVEDIILGCEYLQYETLGDLACASIATKIRNMAVEDMREAFGVDNDFEDSEIEQIREENKWTSAL